jgi:hypothetical protein
MNEQLSSLKSDLSDRRLLPILLLLGLLLVGAIAYSVLAGGGSGSSAPSAAVASPSAAPGSLPAASQAPVNPNAAASETTDGAQYQRQGGAHDPFVPLASPASASKTQTATGGSTASSASTTSSSPAVSAPSSSTTQPSSPSTSSGGGTNPSQPSKPAPSKPKRKPQPVYMVAALFGVAPTTPGQLSQLTPYADLKRLEPLPSASEPRIVFSGASAGGKGAIFTLAGEAILKGEGTCLPSGSQCEAIELTVGQAEELSYFEPSGQTVVYELKVVSISKKEASAATAARLNHRDKAGQALLRRLDPAVLRDLRFSSARGVLVYLTHRRPDPTHRRR